MSLGRYRIQGEDKKLKLQSANRNRVALFLSRQGLLRQRVILGMTMAGGYEKFSHLSLSLQYNPCDSFSRVLQVSYFY